MMATATAECVGDTLRVRGELDFDSVAELWERAETPLLDESISRVDLGGVRRSNSAGVALLVEWLREAQQRQQVLLFTNVPAQMRAIIEVVDLETLLPGA
ncbi:MAG: STAS domain-containing protein [Candidatus Competibacteraceae bacterium]|nr:STAS domain-containing protein [Candidatus Competibacteraceae bacterium]MBK7982750.1 STAS domain-containing protein [Candidatus Competibacteraceae bacterium]MBK8898703.1 STAS domain-containing protein [Candidatus Competibacteraceae bacterium]MBK8962503.1 STAS domain-containing protein [Candidatus Competibacteraceae bacterium]MBK9951717.1 STAS domain-containing protein [Candidatus Competibacteraceae bacterium]